uniref:Uncharacterized protein n=1 Tax=Magnetococcus massalia (strain MO-1) TaxID=451514 RepID=A0A1S7LD08_MAGMO|nr:Protein of unknown function [Candidatus Magnetococcus massalia]
MVQSEIIFATGSQAKPQKQQRASEDNAEVHATSEENLQKTKTKTKKTTPEGVGITRH